MAVVNRSIFIAAAYFFALSSTANMPAPPIDRVRECAGKKIGETCLLDWSGLMGACRMVDEKLVCSDTNQPKISTKIEGSTDQQAKETTLPATEETQAFDNDNLATQGCTNVTSFPGSIVSMISILLGLLLALRIRKK